ncbi:mCG140971, partial [Mus musculus]
PHGSSLLAVERTPTSADFFSLNPCDCSGDSENCIPLYCCRRECVEEHSGSF